jgi:hypothetical protein
MARQIKASDLFDNDDIFKGVRESAEKTIEVLEKVKGEFKQMADESKKAISNADLSNVKGISEFISATEKANKLKKDTITIEQQELTAKKNLIAIQKEEEKLKQEKLKTAQKEQKIANDQIKASEKATKQAQNEANAYKQLEANTRALKNQSKELAAQMLEMERNGTQNSFAYEKLAKQYNEVTNAARENDRALKSIDKTVGDNFRNVGNYEGATQNLKKELRELTKTLQTMETTDPRFAEMSMRAGELKDQISDTNAVIKATAGSGVENLAGALGNAGSIGVAAFQGVESAMALMGVESEAVMQTMMRLQALAGLGDALKTLGGIGDTLTEIRAGFTAALQKFGLFTTATKTQAVAQTGLKTATEGSAKATDLLGKSMKAIPIIALISGIFALVSNWDAVSEALFGVNEGQEALNETLDSYKSGVTEAATKTNEVAVQFDLAKKGVISKDEALTYYNETLGDTFGKASNLNEAERIFNEKTDAYIEAAGMRAQAQALISKAAEETAKKLTASLETESSWYADALGGFFGQYTSLANVGYEALQGNIKSTADVQKAAVEGFTYLSMQSQKANTKDVIDQATKREGVYMNEAKKLMTNAATIEKQFKITTKSNEKVTKSVEKKTIKEYEFNESLKETNDYLTQQIELQQKLTEVLQQRDLDAITREIDAQIMSIQNLIRTGQEFDTNKLRELLDKKAQMESDNIEQRRQYELAAMKQTYIDKAELEMDNLNKDFEDNKKNIEDKAAKEIKTAAGNKTEIARINKEKTEALADLDAQYLLENEKVAANIIKMTEDLKTELEIINAKANEELIKNDETAQTEYLAKLDEVDTAYNDYLDRRVESSDEATQKEIEIETKRAETLQSIADQLTTYFIDQSNKKIEQMDKEIEAAQSQYDTLKTLAENGNINAKESLAEQQRIINEANRKKEKELRRQQAIQMASAVYSTYNAKVLEGVENPLIETIKDTVLLQQFANTLLSQMPAFFDGTEDTGTHGQGVDGKGGFHAILHPHERVIPKSLNEQIGAMSNEQLTMLAQQYNNGRLIGSNGQVGTAFETAVLVNKIDELKNTIKNKPETNIELGEITQSMMHIVKTTKQGNTIKTNRFKIRK